MPIKYRVIQRGQPGVAGGGVKKFYATPITEGESSIEDLTTDIERMSTISGADIRGVLYALVDVITQRLSDGRIVRLDALGSMQVSMSSEGFETEEEVNGAAIRSTRVLFRPGPKLKNMLRTLSFKKVATTPTETPA